MTYKVNSLNTLSGMEKLIENTKHKLYNMLTMEGERSLLIKSTLQGVIGEFSHEITTNPVPYDAPDDIFGSLARGSYELFMELTDKHLHGLEGEIDTATAQELRNKLRVSQLGIGVISVLFELVPLVCKREFPGVPLNSDEAAQIAANSYDFVDLVIDSGSRVGASIVRDWIRPDFSPATGWHFSGTLVDGQLDNYARLSQFDLGLTWDHRDVKVVPRGLDEAITNWESQIEDKRENSVDCPAQIFRDSSTDLPYARSLFDGMLEHVRQFVYPQYLIEIPERIG